MTESTSRFMPWAAPAASFIRRPSSSKNRLLVWVMLRTPRPATSKMMADRMAIRAAACKMGPSCHALVSLSSYLLRRPAALYEQPGRHRAEPVHAAGPYEARIARVLPEAGRRVHESQ